MKVLKRSKAYEKFSPTKIAFAIKNASEGLLTDDECSTVTDKVCSLIYNLSTTELTVDIINNIVEDVLYTEGYIEVAKQYSKFRIKNKLSRDIIDSEYTNIISNYLHDKDWLIKENANSSYSLQGLHGYITETVTKRYWLNNIFSPEAKYAHENGDLHIHDLGILAPYCFTGDTKVKLLDGRNVDFKTLATESEFVNGFWVYSCDIEGNVVPGYATNPRITRKNASLVEIVLDNNEIIKCTPDHLFMLSDGTYKRADSLLTTDNLMTMCGYKITSVRSLDYTEDVYDLTVDKYHNFALDAGVFVHNCLGNDLGDLLTVGFRGAPGKTTSRPAKHLSTALGQLVNFIYSMQGNSAGANAVSNFDTYMAAFVKKDNLNESQIKQALQEFIYSINIPTRVSFSVPFSNITLDIKVSDNLKDQPAIVGGEFQDFTYGDCQDEVYLFDRCLFEVLSEGDDSGNVFTFPVVTINIVPDFEFDRPELKNLWEHVAKYGTVTFANYVNSSMDIKQTTSMCCFTGDTEITIKDSDGVEKTIMMYDLPDGIFKVQQRGRWLDAKKVVVPYYVRFIYLELANGLSYRMTKDHLNLVKYKNSSNLFLHPTEIFKTMHHGKLPLNRSHGEILHADDFEWVEIVKSVMINAPEDTAYCVSIIDDLEAPYFELANGLFTHNCRLLLDTTKLQVRSGSMFGAAPLTGSCSVVSINLARIGGTVLSENEFLARIDSLLDISKDILIKRREFIEDNIETGLYPYLKYYLRNIKTRTGRYLTNHFNTIGVVGGHEACLNLFGEGIDTPRGKDFAKKILDHINEVLLEFQKETGYLFNLEAVPAESAATRFAKLDIEKLGPRAHYQGTKEAPYLTNSTQLPVSLTDDLFYLLDSQEELHTKYTGGTCLNIFAGERIKDIEVIKNLIKKITSLYKIPYFAISPVFSTCDTCGYIDGEHEECPKCGKKATVWARVIGYVRPRSSCNVGKEQEMHDRKYLIKEESNVK